MIVTDKKYSMDNIYISKLDLMIKRMEGTDDNILLVDGDEGQGKTEFSIGTCYYVSNKTGRAYNPNHIFFDLDEGMKFAGETKEQIIHFDEGALGLLSVQWWNKNQQKFLQLVMIARKKKHFMIICIPKFYKMNQYIVEERSIGLVHVYSRKNLEKGRFCYFTKRGKERLYYDWKRKKTKTYKKHHAFHGSFVKAMEKVFTKEECDKYEQNKDEAIMNLTQKDSKPEITKREVMTEIFLRLKEAFPEITNKEWSLPFQVSERTLKNYSSEERMKKMEQHTAIPKEN